MNINQVFRESESLPEDNKHEAHYVYHPRPPDVKNPPISRVQFERYLRTCNTFCLWFYLPLSVHRCSHPHEDSHKWKRIPRKKSIFDAKAEQPGEVAYGIEAVYTLSFPVVFIYSALLFLPWIGFWRWWLENNPNDLQNASVPTMVFFAIFATFWALPGRRTDI
jgi:hypothetical protein